MEAYVESEIRIDIILKNSRLVRRQRGQQLPNFLQFLLIFRITLTHHRPRPPPDDPLRVQPATNRLGADREAKLRFMAWCC